MEADVIFNPNPVHDHGDTGDPNSVPDQGDTEDPNSIPDQGDIEDPNSILDQGDAEDPNRGSDHDGTGDPNVSAVCHTGMILGTFYVPSAACFICYLVHQVEPLEGYFSVVFMEKIASDTLVGFHFEVVSKKTLSAAVCMMTQTGCIRLKNP